MNARGRPQLKLSAYFCNRWRFAGYCNVARDEVVNTLWIVRVSVHSCFSGCRVLRQRFCPCCHASIRCRCCCTSHRIRALTVWCFAVCAFRIDGFRSTPYTTHSVPLERWSCGCALPASSSRSADARAQPRKALLATMRARTETPHHSTAENCQRAI